MDDTDRRDCLLLQTWEKQMELRVARKLLLERTVEQLGLCLHIASYWPTREALTQFSGYNRMLRPECYAVIPRRLPGAREASEGRDSDCDPDSEPDPGPDNGSASESSASASASGGLEWQLLAPCPSPRIDCATVCVRDQTHANGPRVTNHKRCVNISLSFRRQSVAPWKRYWCVELHF